MEEFLFSLLAGLFGYAVVMYALWKAFRQYSKVEAFCEKHIPWIVPHLWWLILLSMLYTVVEIAQFIGKNFAGVTY